MPHRAYRRSIYFTLLAMLCLSSTSLAITNKNLPSTKIEKTTYINKKKRNPFLETSTSNQTKPAKLPKGQQKPASIHQMHLIGTVKLGDNIWAIIKDNYGNLFKVKQGDKIGSERATITYITNNSVKLIKQEGDIQRVWILKITR